MESEPVENGGEEDKGEEIQGEFVVAGGNTAEALDAGEEVFDAMAETITGITFVDHAE